MSTIDFLAAQKRQALLSALDRGVAMLHVNIAYPGVDVPPQFAGDRVIRLNLAYGFNLPTLDVGTDSVYAVLSFSGVNYGCTIPWGAVFGVSMPSIPGGGAWWEGSAPGEPRAQALAKAEEKPLAAEPARLRAVPAVIRAVVGEPPAAEPACPPMPRGRPALTMIRGGR